VIDVEQVDFVSVPTRDAARAQRFYADVLGLPRSGRTPGELEAPNVTFSFWEPEADGVRFAPNTAGVALRVADVHAARAELESKGVEFIGETVDTGVCHMGFFRDPDGNVLILHKRYS
jgi:catechol 2,3-dioxygenase-like lactoylglutathione lyase family enzyme